MKMKLAFLMALIITLAACGGPSAQPQPQPVDENDRNFYYQDTRWDMSLDDVIALRGKPDVRTDEIELTEREKSEYGVYEDIIPQEDAPPEGFWDDEEDEDSKDASEAPQAPQNIDLYYYEKPIFDKYTATEQFLFDSAHKLQGVINVVDVGEVSKDLTNRDEIVERTEGTYMDIKEKLTERFGPPAAEYTAYREAGDYKVLDELDFEMDNALICASRWDGDNYRFIYIIYFMDNLILDVRYIPHDKETVDAAKTS